jgi:cytochrome P450
MSKLTDIERELNPFSIYRELRQDDPVYMDPQRRSWNIFRYDDVQRALSDWKTFSSQFARIRNIDTSMPFSASMISSDPPRHRQLRSLVTQAFTPKAVEALGPRIEEIVKEQLDWVMEQESMDVIGDLGIPLPVTVIAELLGIPPSDRDRFKRWSDVVVSRANFGENMDPAQFMNPDVIEMGQYFFNMIMERRQSPGDDLISGLLAANIDGEQLSEIELLGFCMLLLVAGNETTTNLIGNAMLTFAEQPEAWQALRNKPELLDTAIEEVLRFRSPVQAMFRVTQEDVAMAGKTIPAGSRVVAWIGSANHDESQFQDPECFDIRREPNRHLAFGYGIHYCLGAPLARLEARIALREMLERFRTFKIPPETKLEPLPSLIVFGVRSLPIEFQKA